jgi:23S rRNA (guanosine2251-2'-O)-methyltransferase
VSDRVLITGKRAVLEAIRAGRASDIRIADSARATPGLKDVFDAAAQQGAQVREVSRQELDSLAADNRGVVAYITPADDLSERDLSTWDFDDEAIVVVLDGVTDPQNLGACARAADAAGAAMLVSRTKRAAGVTPSAIRASAGALLALPHARVANITRAVERLKDERFTIVGLDEEAPADIYAKDCSPGRIALVVGSEGEGITRLVREACDELVSVPMRGRVASLNASNSLAAALFGYVLRRPAAGGR